MAKRKAKKGLGGQMLPGMEPERITSVRGYAIIAGRGTDKRAFIMRVFSLSEFDGTTEQKGARAYSTALMSVVGLLGREIRPCTVALSFAERVDGETEEV